MTAWFANSPNADDECCGDPCEDREDPCDPCDGCPCEGLPLPDEVEVITYERQEVGRSGCKREVFVITGCSTHTLVDPLEDDCRYTGGLSYFASPISKWMLGDAVAVGDGCGGLLGEYTEGGVLKHLVTLSTAGQGTIEGDMTETGNCQDCDCGSGVTGSG